MNKFEAWFRVVRPLIVFICCFGSSVGFLNATLGAGLEWTTGYTFSLILTIIGAGLLGAGMMVHNDYTDLKSDLVNRPNKPLCCGAIKPNTARWTGIILMVLSVVFATTTTIPLGNGVNWLLGAFTVVHVVNAIWYNRVGKLNGIWGHVSVAFGVGAIPFWGALAARPGLGDFSTLGEWALLLPLALGIGVQEVGREIMVCIGDLKGDRACGWKTTPVRVGRDRAMIVAIIFYIFSLPFLLYAYFVWGGFPDTGFGYVYLAGAIGFWLILMLTWVNVYRIIKTKDEKKIWDAFEKNIRTGTRLGVVGFQIILMIEAFV